MNASMFIQSRILSTPSFSSFYAVWRRSMLFLERPAIGAAAAVFIALGVLLYSVMLFMSFDIGMRLRDAALAHEKEREALRQMEVREREQEAGFVEHHRALLQKMQEVAGLKYLASENTALSEARGDSLFRQ